ncbi:MAG TPA: phosphate--AMP phosphotransferase, partial [Clostridiales bacterium]|nr:phosphate--AMP phosphotransferase [Clostridiales bacterium]
MLKNAYLNEKPEKELLKSRLKEQEDLLFVNQNKIKDNKLPVVVLIEGWGTAGKGTLIGNVINNIDPRFYKVATFDMPTDLEKRKPFLCRYFEALPEAGKFRFYNTGWMNEIVMSRLDGSMPNSLYEKRIASIRRFERQL